LQIAGQKFSDHVPFLSPIYQCQGSEGDVIIHDWDSKRIWLLYSEKGWL